MDKKKHSKPKFDRESREEDITFLIKEIKKIHKDPYRYVGKKEFEKSLQKSLTVEDKFFALAIQEALALIQDAHTRIDLIRDDLLPFYLVRLSDKNFYIIGSNQKKALGTKLISINKYKISDIIKKIKNLSSKENSEQTFNDLERFIPSNGILKYYGFSDSENVEVKTNKGVFIFTENTDSIFEKKNPFKWKDKNYTGNEDYKFKIIHNNLIFQYNRCYRGEYTEKQLKDFKEKLLREAKLSKNILIDLRQNTGGDTEVMRGAFDKLPDNIPIYVATSRKTFSSAMHHLIDLKERQHAVQIGENAGQRPNRFGQGENITLPNSKIVVTCSCKYFELIPGSNLKVIKPDIYIPLTVQNYITETDPLDKWIEENLN